MRLISTKTREVPVEDAVFTIRSLDSEERARLMEESFIVEPTGPESKMRMRINLVRYQLRACQEGIVDWKGIKDENGKEVPFDKNLVKRLEPHVLDTLSSEIIGTAGLSEEEEASLRG